VKGRRVDACLDKVGLFDSVDMACALHSAKDVAVVALTLVVAALRLVIKPVVIVACALLTAID
jgi:hypothetical protein